MGEWSDREYEMRYVDHQGNILVDDDPENDSEADSDDSSDDDQYKYKYDYKYKNSLLVGFQLVLTPEKFLNKEQKKIRNKLLTGYQDTMLEVRHNPNNPHDNKALEVYFEATFIGHIRKNFQDMGSARFKESLDEFCFFGGNMESLELSFYHSSGFNLTKKTEDILRSLGREQELDEKNIYLLRIWEWALKNDIHTLPFDKHKLTNASYIECLVESISYGNYREKKVPTYRAVMELPPEIGKLSKLETLELGTLGLTRLPDEIGELVNLKRLSLNENHLSALPDSVENLQKLESISLDYNEFEQFPKSLLHLTNIDSLSVSDNILSTIPNTISRLTKLQFLNLANNKITHLPDEIGELNKLNTLLLSGNCLTTLPNSAEKISKSFSSSSLHSNSAEIKIPGEKESSVFLNTIIFFVIIIVLFVLTN
jgi:hypothetical protein